MDKNVIKMSVLISKDLLNLINKVQEENPNASESLIEARAKIHEFIYSNSSKIRDMDVDEISDWLADYMIEHDLSPEYIGEGSICDELD